MRGARSKTPLLGEAAVLGAREWKRLLGGGGGSSVRLLPHAAPLGRSDARRLRSAGDILTSCGSAGAAAFLRAEGVSSVGRCPLVLREHGRSRAADRAAEQARDTAAECLPATQLYSVPEKGMQLVGTGTIVFEDIPCILKFVNQRQLWCLTSKGLWWGWAWPSIWKINWSNIESLEMVTLLWRLLFYERCFEGIHSLWNEFMLFILPPTE